MNKDYYEELMDKYYTWKELVIDLIRDKLDNYKDVSTYGCDLAYTLFEGENVDGSMTYSTYWSIELIRKYWDDFADIYQEYVDSTGSTLNPFDSAESFVVVMLLEEAQNILSESQFISDNWNNKITLDTKTINKINKDLDNLVE